MNRRSDMTMSASLCVAAALTVAACDQLSKAAAERMPCGTFVCAVTNDELMMGAGPGHAALVTFATVAGATGFVAWALAYRSRVSAFALGIIAGGIAGNSFDRLVRGHVRDFLVLPYVVANLADIAVASGMCTCALGTLSRRARSTKGGDHEAPTPIDPGDLARGSARRDHHRDNGSTCEVVSPPPGVRVAMSGTPSGRRPVPEGSQAPALRQ